MYRGCRGYRKIIEWMLLIKLSSVTLGESTRRNQNPVSLLPYISVGVKENSQHMVQSPWILTDMLPVAQAMKIGSAPNSTTIVIIITISSFNCYHSDRTKPTSLLPYCSSAHGWVGVIWLYNVHTLYISLFLKFGSMCDYLVSKIDSSITVFCGS